MALIEGTGGAQGRHGPQYRRQTGTTLPGERTQAELMLLNHMRQRMGLPALGGPAQRGASPARGFGSREEGGGLPAGPEQPGGGLDAGGAEAGGLTFDMGLVPLPNQQLPPEHDLEALRQRLLASVQQPHQAVGSSVLRRYMQQAQMRRATHAGPRRAILPQRPPMRSAQAAGSIPY